MVVLNRYVLPNGARPVEYELMHTDPGHRIRKQLAEKVVACFLKDIVRQGTRIISITYSENLWGTYFFR